MANGRIGPGARTGHGQVLVGAARHRRPDDGARQAIREIIETLQSLYLEFHLVGYPRSAVCLSGGGIRSAAFALGVLQQLARVASARKISLPVYGFGRRLYRKLAIGVDRSERGYRNIRDRLGRREAPDNEARSIKRIRENSNFLTPKLGALSADTWAALAILIRNLLFNWLIIVP